MSEELNLSESAMDNSVGETMGIDESENRIIISKEDFLQAMGTINSITREYGALLDEVSETDEWNKKAVGLIKSHHELVRNGESPLGKLDLVFGLFLYLAKRIHQDQFRFRMHSRIGNIPEVEDENLKELSNHLKDLRFPIDRIFSEIEVLTESGKVKSNEKIQSVLMAVLALFKAILRQDWKDVSLLVTHLNLVTTTQESHSIVRQVARIARNIYNSLNEFSQNFTLESISQSTVEIPDAVVKLRSVINKLEEAANTNLDSLEKLNAQARQDMEWLRETQECLVSCSGALEALKGENANLTVAIDAIQADLNGDINKDLDQLLIWEEEKVRTFINLISNQSFQDLTGQTLKKVITFVEALQFKLIELLPKSDIDTREQEKEIDETDQASTLKSPVQNQDQVDKMLADLGF